jgi:hypothetical protein
VIRRWVRAFAVMLGAGFAFFVLAVVAFYFVPILLGELFRSR